MLWSPPLPSPRPSPLLLPLPPPLLPPLPVPLLEQCRHCRCDHHHRRRRCYCCRHRRRSKDRAKGALQLYLHSPLLQTTRRNAEIKKRAKLEAKLTELGLTEEEYNAQEAAKKALPRNTTVSNEVRAKISAALKVHRACSLPPHLTRVPLALARGTKLPDDPNTNLPRRDGETLSTEKR